MGHARERQPQQRVGARPNAGRSLSAACHRLALLAAARVITFEGQRLLTNASGFFFERGERLFLVTSRHVMIDEPSKHFPDRIEIELHIDAAQHGQLHRFFDAALPGRQERVAPGHATPAARSTWR